MVINPLTLWRMDDMHTLTDNLEYFMKVSGLDNQSKLSRATDLSQTNISNIQRHTVSPTLDTLTRLSEALGIETWQLLAPEAARRLFRVYARLSDDEQNMILRVAESLAKGQPADIE